MQAMGAAWSAGRRKMIELEAQTLDALTREHERYVHLAIVAAQIRRVATALHHLDEVEAILAGYLPVAAMLLEHDLADVADRVTTNRAEIYGLRTRLCEDALSR